MIFLNLNKFNPEWCIDDLQGFSKKLYIIRVHIRLFLKFNFKIISSASFLFSTNMCFERYSFVEDCDLNLSYSFLIIEISTGFLSR